MTLARGIAKGIGAGVASAVTRGQGASGGGASYDTDALDYFTRSEGLGGSFNLTSINATYTESYVKTAISTFVAGCKTDNVWTKITEAYLLSGVTFGGLMAKLKHAGTATLTNANFVTGDYLAAGSGAGLLGNGSTKYLDTTLSDSALSADNKSLGVYITGAASARSVVIGQRSGSDGNMLYNGSATIATDLFFPESSGQIGAAFSSVTGIHIGSRRGVNDLESYTNGTSTKVLTTTAAATNNARNYFLFKNNRGVAEEVSNARLAFGFIGTGLTDTDASNLSARVNALATALGWNTY